MAQQTQLTVTATPGRVQSFAAKTEAVAVAVFPMDVVAALSTTNDVVAALNQLHNVVTALSQLHDVVATDSVTGD